MHHIFSWIFPFVILYINFHFFLVDFSFWAVCKLVSFILDDFECLFLSSLRRFIVIFTIFSIRLIFDHHWAVSVSLNISCKFCHFSKLFNIETNFKKVKKKPQNTVFSRLQVFKYGLKFSLLFKNYFKTSKFCQVHILKMKTEFNKKSKITCILF